jgi:hypothetical protein
MGETTMLTRLSSQALGIAALSLLLCLPAQAQRVEVGTGVFCDTQKQMERFVALFDGDEETAVNDVNAEANDPSACGFGTIAYVRGPEIATARATTGTSTFHIVRVLVVAVLTEAGFRSAAPAPLFAVEQVDEREA